MTRKSSLITVCRAGALVAVFGLVGGLSAETSAYAQQTINGTEIVTRLKRLERDMRDLQAETFRRSPDGKGAATPATAAPPGPAASAEPAQPIPDLGPMMRRVDELEASVTRLTGQ